MSRRSAQVRSRSSSNSYRSVHYATGNKVATARRFASNITYAERRIFVPFVVCRQVLCSFVGVVLHVMLLFIAIRTRSLAAGVVFGLRLVRDPRCSAQLTSLPLYIGICDFVLLLTFAAAGWCLRRGRLPHINSRELVDVRDTLTTHRFRNSTEFSRNKLLARSVAAV